MIRYYEMKPRTPLLDLAGMVRSLGDIRRLASRLVPIVRTPRDPRGAASERLGELGGTLAGRPNWDQAPKHFGFRRARVSNRAGVHPRST